MEELDGSCRNLIGSDRCTRHSETGTEMGGIPRKSKPKDAFPDVVHALIGHVLI